MKRYSLLLLLCAFLLPVRGALAAAGLFCHVDGAHPAAVAPSHSHDAAEHAGAHHSHDAHHEHAAGRDAPMQPDTCKYCAAVCSIPPVAPADLTLRAPVAPGGERFAALDVPPSSPYASGLERPPRSI